MDKKESNSFFALVFRQKYINRWGLMRSVTGESLAVHSAETAIVAHALAMIGNEFFGKSYDAGRVAAIALFHDAPEVFTGDLPTPVKYFSDGMRESYRQIERGASKMLLSKLPDRLRGEYAAILEPASERDKPLVPLVKAADKLCAYIKCVEEEKSGNFEFRSAREALLATLKAFMIPELDFFMREFLPPFELTLDSQLDIGD